LEQAYETTYTNLREHINTKHKIKRLKMEKGDLDTYVATFNKLMTLARYMDTKYRALTLFKKGLPTPLNIAII